MTEERLGELNVRPYHKQQIVSPDVLCFVPSFLFDEDDNSGSGGGVRFELDCLLPTDPGFGGCNSGIGILLRWMDRLLGGT